MLDLQIQAFGATDRGLVRDDNEDNLLVREARQVYVVADGLGGLPEGALASRLAVETLDRLVTSSTGPLVLKDLVAQVNARVFAEGEKISEDLGIGTTLTVAHLDGSLLNLAHVGDTGAFLFREGSIAKLTVDHTMAQDMLDRLGADHEEEIPEYFHHTLTRCIGQAGEIDIDLYSYELCAGDRILIYSDGVTKTISHEELGAMVGQFQEPESYVNHIIKIANQRGGPDNVTALALFVEEASGQPDGEMIG